MGFQIVDTAVVAKLIRFANIGRYKFVLVYVDGIKVQA